MASSSSWSETPDYTFAFNAINFSDRVLRIQIIEEKEYDDGDGSVRNTTIQVTRFEDIHINSLILAAKSPFFLKLFSNGMKESAESHVTIQIKVSEEDAFMDLLHFIYSNKLHSTTEGAIFAVLRIADKFEVVSCIQYCCHVLRNMEMSLESALLCLELHSNLLLPDVAQPLVNVAKQFLESRFSDYSRCHDEILKLPLAAFEVVLASDDFQVPYEGVIFDLVLKYVRIHYHSIEEQRNVLQTRLTYLIRYSFFTCDGLRKLLTPSGHFDQEFISSVVMEALFLKAERRQPHHFLSNDNPTHHIERPRNWSGVPVSVIEFNLSQRQCAVYLELKREVCAKIFSQGRVVSQPFTFNNLLLSLVAVCNTALPVGFRCLDLFIAMHGKCNGTCFIGYKFSVRSKPKEDFEEGLEMTVTFRDGKQCSGTKNILKQSELMADDSKYFINDTLHVKAELKGDHLRNR